MYCELHTRSAFSFLASGSTPEMLAAQAEYLGLETVSLIDKDSVSGAVRFYLAAKELKIKPIIGAEITLWDGTCLPLVPIDLRGYNNLSKLITTIKLRNKKGEHFATREDIQEYSCGLLCYSGGADGFIANSIRNGEAIEDLAWLKDVFNDRLYIELQRHFLRNEEDINQTLLSYARSFRIPYFASSGACYATKDDRELFDVFTCIKNHRTLSSAGRLLSHNGEHFLRSEADMRSLFADLPEAIETTGDIAFRITFELNELAYSFPDYPVPHGQTMDSFLRLRAEDGARTRYGTLTAEVRRRLDKELTLISKKGLAGYFLVVWDISRFCRDLTDKEKIILSQGRGSAANSVVCYSLGITAVDPIKHDLLFERFLSEKHEEYPDIDIDLPSGDDREKVIQYVYGKYKERGAAMTANVISYRGRSAIREVGKVFGWDSDALSKISRLNSHYETFSGDELYRKLKEDGFDASDNWKIAKFTELYKKILDFPRHLGQHSGGMVISMDRLDGIVPIEPASMPGRTIIQWDKTDCEALKIIKVDLLGLGMMAVLRDTITLISTHHRIELDLYQVPQNDPKVFTALQEADTVGMFQVESRAQIAFLPKTKPEKFYDIVVQVAIIRPGPIAGKMLSSYVNRRLGKEKVEYLHESLIPNLERTLGVPLFQEQLLKIAMELADFTGAEAAELRQAMGFKRPGKKLERISANLRKGMSRKGIGPDVQEKIVECVMAFSNYGFPESHAYSFALLAYASAYFIVHYRACFMAAMLNNYPLGFYSTATLIKDAQRHGLRFRAIDINHSDYVYTVEMENGKEAVRIGLRSVRGLRKQVGELIISERTQKGPYANIQDLSQRVPQINKRELRSLSLAGAFNFDGRFHRRAAMWESELAARPQGDLFESVSYQFEEKYRTDFEMLNGLELVDADIKRTGFSIGKHPMKFFREKLDEIGVLSSKQISSLKKGQTASVAGGVIVRQRPMTANNVVFITLEDEFGHSNFVVMPDVFEKFRATINQNDYLMITGVYEQDLMLRALNFKPLTDISSKIVSHNFR